MVRAVDAVWILPPQVATLGSAVALVAALSWRAGAAFAVVVFMGLTLQSPAPFLKQWNAGQGDAALARFDDGASWVLDAGPAFSWRPERWMHRLAESGVSRVDLAVLSHLDEDHRGGLAALLAWIQVDEGVARTEHLQEARERYPGLTWRTPQENPKGGWSWFQPQVAKSANGVMLGWAWKQGERLYLNLGDAPEKLERSLERELARMGALEWTWKLSHHGSRTSTPAEWFSRFPIREAWVSAGHANQHGHPHASVLRKIPLRVRVRVTSEEGDLFW